LGAPTNLLAKVAIAVTDLAGNLATQTLRYLPDDLYLDNLAPQYSEGQGSWTSTTNCAWGTDARTALLESNTTARAGWDLPLSWSGRYRISIQVPSLPHLATNVLVNVLSEGTNVCSVLFPDGIPTNQWAFVVSVVLDHAVSNHVEMTVTGVNQPGAVAAADVLRVVPVSEATVPAHMEARWLTLLPTLNGYLLRFSAKANLRYSVQRSLNPATDWSTLQIISPVADGILEYLDLKPSLGQSFYRIVEQ